MNTPSRRERRGVVPDLRERMESPMSMLRPFTLQPIRVESYTDDGHYVVRAELPGVDPEKQVEVTVEAGILTIRAERREKHTGRYHSEFRYGAFSRQVPLPETADPSDVSATYEQGVLAVSIGLKKREGGARQIPVIRGGG